MFTISPDDSFIIGQTINSSGFRRIMQLLQQTSDDLANQLQVADTDEKERRALTEWRAYRSLLATLQNLSNATQENLPDALDPMQYERRQNQLRAELQGLGVFGSGFGNMDSGEQY